MFCHRSWLLLTDWDFGIDNRLAFLMSCEGPADMYGTRKLLPYYRKLTMHFINANFKNSH